jgi:excisionase family DNA binding protein
MKYLNIDEAAEYLGLKATTLRKWTYERRVPYRKHGGKTVFSAQDLDTWSEKNKVEPIESEHDTLLSSLTKEYSDIG